MSGLSTPSRFWSWDRPDVCHFVFFLKFPHQKKNVVCILVSNLEILASENYSLNTRKFKTIYSFTFIQEIYDTEILRLGGLPQNLETYRLSWRVESPVLCQFWHGSSTATSQIASLFLNLSAWLFACKVSMQLFVGVGLFFCGSDFSFCFFFVHFLWFVHFILHFHLDLCFK